MIWNFEGGETNPENLEKELGLNRGDIEEITIFATGAVIITGKNIVDTASNKAKADAWLKARGLGRGKIPTEG